MNVTQWLDEPRRRSLVGTPEIDALTEEHALDECALVRFSVDLVLSRALLLIDCRGALTIRDSNAAVLALSGVETVTLTRAGTPGLRWPCILGWRPNVTATRFELSVGLQDATELRFRAVDAEYYEGDVPCMDDAPLDLTTAGLEEIANAFFGEASEFEVHGGSFTRP